MLSGSGKVCKFIGKESAAEFAPLIVWEASAREGIPPIKRIRPRNKVEMRRSCPIDEKFLGFLRQKLPYNLFIITNLILTKPEGRVTL